MIYLVIPCYNEQDVLMDTNRRLLALLPEIPTPTSILYVDDGSTDGTWNIIMHLCQEHNAVRGLRLSHNVGQQTATWAGMEHCLKDADAVISVDADLQDDIHVIPRMVHDWQQGIDVVYGVRHHRESDSWMKRWTALLFYRVMGWLGCETIYNHSEFRLLSRRAVEALLSYPERNLFVRGLVSQLGFNVELEYYDRQPRLAGETKYSISKLAALAFDGVSSFSVRPLHWILLAGLSFIVVAVCVIGWALFNHFTGRTVMGWTSLLVSVWFVGGCLLLALGLIGEYVGKVYKETKRRPRYFVMDSIRLADEQI